jgi:acyl-CoA thioesterase I
VRATPPGSFWRTHPSAGHVDRLPFRAGEIVVGVGDSITDDLQSWLETVRLLLELRRPEGGIRVVNAGLSAHTTAMVLRRFVPHGRSSPHR